MACTSPPGCWRRGPLGYGGRHVWGGIAQQGRFPDKDRFGRVGRVGGSTCHLEDWRMRRLLSRKRTTSVRRARRGDNKGGEEGEEEEGLLNSDTRAAILAAGATTGLTLIANAISDGELARGFSFLDERLRAVGVSPGDVLATLLWSWGLWGSPDDWTLLNSQGLRVSDLVIRSFGLALMGKEKVNKPEYQAPFFLQAVVAMLFLAVGAGITFALDAGFDGDSTWSVAGGTAIFMPGLIYGAVRPKQLSSEEAVFVEDCWQDFCAFADLKLLRSGRCHETDVVKAFRREYARYRTNEQIKDEVIVKMAQTWAGPKAKRSKVGFFKGLSLNAKYDMSSS